MHKIPFEIEESDEFAEICEYYQPILVAQTLPDKDDDDNPFTTFCAQTIWSPLLAVLSGGERGRGEGFAIAANLANFPIFSVN